jgi:hypothetical protein
VCWSAICTALASAKDRRSRSNAFDGGTVVETDSSTGLGFSFDWRFADRWSAGATLAIHAVPHRVRHSRRQRPGTLKAAPG